MPADVRFTHATTQIFPWTRQLSHSPVSTQVAAPHVRGGHTKLRSSRRIALRCGELKAKLHSASLPLCRFSTSPSFCASPLSASLAWLQPGSWDKVNGVCSLNSLIRTVLYVGFVINKCSLGFCLLANLNSRTCVLTTRPVGSRKHVHGTLPSNGRAPNLGQVPTRDSAESVTPPTHGALLRQLPDFCVRACVRACVFQAGCCGPATPTSTDLGVTTAWWTWRALCFALHEAVSDDLRLDLLHSELLQSITQCTKFVILYKLQQSSDVVRARFLVVENFSSCPTRLK